MQGELADSQWSVRYNNMSCDDGSDAGDGDGDDEQDEAKLMPPPQTGREKCIDSICLTPCHNNQRLLRNRIRRRR